MMYPENPIETFLQSFRSRVEKNVWRDGGKSWRGGDWLRQVDQWTQAFQSKAVTAHQIVVISLPPSIEACTAVLALWRLGATAFLVPPELPCQDILRWSESAKAVGGVVSSAVAELCSTQLGAAWDWGWVSDRSFCPEGWSTMEKVLYPSSPDMSSFSPVAWNASQRALLSLSSGTWQPPVGVSLNQQQVWHTIDNVKENWLHTTEETTDQTRATTGGILDLPLCSSWLTTSLAVLGAGGMVFNQVGMSWLGLGQTASSCETPSICLTTAQNVRRWLVSCTTEEQGSFKEVSSGLRWIWALGGFLPPVHKMSGWSTPVYSAYKIEACGGIVAWANSNQQGVGKVFSGTNLRVEREPNKHRKPGDPLRGEILLEGTRVSTQRLDTESRWFDVECRYPGYLSTGDWGILDRHQYLHIEGHLEDMVEYRDGFFSTRPIEQKLREHRQIQAAVLRCLERNGPLKAFLELDPDAPGHSLSSRTVLAYIQEHFPHYMLPKYVEFRDRLPRNIYGEVARWALQ